MSEKTNEVTDADIAEAFSDGSDPSPAVSQAEGELSVKLDASAPDKDKTVCAICLTDEVIREVMADEEFSKWRLLRILFSKYKALDKLMEIYAKRNWSHFSVYLKFFEILQRVKYSLKTFGEENQVGLSNLGVLQPKPGWPLKRRGSNVARRTACYRTLRGSCNK